MEDNLLDTEQKRASALSALTSLRYHPGWDLIQKMQDANIQVLRMQLEDGTENETKADVDRIRDKIRLTQEFRDLVDKQIKQLSPPDIEPVNVDPFDSVADLIEERKNIDQ